MRLSIFTLALFGTVGSQAIWSQVMTEGAAAAIGGSVGGVAGKSVSGAITAVRDKADAAAAKVTPPPTDLKAPETKAPAKPAPANYSSDSGSGSGSGSGYSSAPAPITTNDLYAPKSKRTTVPPPPPAPVKAQKSKPAAKPTETAAVTTPTAETPTESAPAELPTPEPVVTPELVPTSLENLLPPPPVTADDLRVVTNGMERRDVLKIGSPSARITMFEEGHLIEIFRYTSHDGQVGVIRLTDGLVASVQLRN